MFFSSIDLITNSSLCFSFSPFNSRLSRRCFGWVYFKRSCFWRIFQMDFQKCLLYFEVMLKEAMNLLKQILAPRPPPKWLKGTKMFCTWTQNLIYATVSKILLNMSLKASYFGIRIIFQMSLELGTLDHSLQFRYLCSNENLDVYK